MRLKCSLHTLLNIVLCQCTRTIGNNPRWLINPVIHILRSRASQNTLREIPRHNFRDRNKLIFANHTYPRDVFLFRKKYFPPPPTHIPLLLLLLLHPSSSLRAVTFYILIHYILSRRIPIFRAKSSAMKTGISRKRRGPSISTETGIAGCRNGRCRVDARKKRGWHRSRGERGWVARAIYNIVIFVPIKRQSSLRREISSARE